MNPTPHFGNRIMVILVAVLIVVLFLFALTAILWLQMMNGGVMVGGMNMMTSTHSQMTI